MHELIIYFEEDIQQALPVIEYFESEQCHVLHLTEVPAGGLSEVAQMFSEPPFLLLMDINVQEHCGFDLCQSLKQTEPFKSVPVLFIAQSDGQEDVLKAYEAGAFDYVAKPVHLQSLSAKFDTLRHLRKRAKELQSQVTLSEQMAFDAMVTSSDLGNIIRFHESIADVDNIEALGKTVLNQLTSTGVSASIMFGMGSGKFFYLSDDGKEYVLEQKVFQVLRNQGRIYSWKNRTLYNYDNFAVLVRSMPIDDEVRYGTLKDQICMLLNGVEVRVNGIVNETKLKRSEQSIRTIGQAIAKLAMDMQSSTEILSNKFEKVIHDMEVEIHEDLANLSLMSHEEARLMDHLKSAINEASYIFNTEKAKDAAMAEMLLHLVEQLDNKEQ